MGSLRLPIREVDGRPLAPARITDGVRVRDGLFAIDTAGWSTIVRGGLSRPQASGDPSPVRLRAVELGGSLFEQVPAGVRLPGEADQIDAIGMSVWSRWRLRLDVRRGWLELDP
jgi:hypothetical protein